VGDFYTDLEPVDDFTRIADPDIYVDVPRDWWVLATDVRGSTKAIQSGRYKSVNAVGASTIVALRNLTNQRDLPFVFGGDGATALVPPECLEQARAAAAQAAAMARSGFEMDLRAGVLPVGLLFDHGHPVRVARLRISEHVSLAQLAGGGAAYAEDLLKDPVEGPKYAVPPADAVDLVAFDGFECRWTPLESRRGLVVSVVALALDDGPDDALAIYQRLIGKLREIVADDISAPVSMENAQLAANPATMAVEASVRTASGGGLARLKWMLRTWFFAQIARWLMWTGRKAGSFDGATYKAEMVANSDFRKFSDGLRFVLDVDVTQADAIEAVLADERKTGAIAYGVHRAGAALMTCMVPGYSGWHVHFIDGADGGYALAAKGLKAQLAEAKG
jgi:hypothetical protein